MYADLEIMIVKQCSLAVTASQSIGYQQHSHEVFEKTHYMECTTRLSNIALSIVAGIRFITASDTGYCAMSTSADWLVPKGETKERTAPPDVVP